MVLPAPEGAETTKRIPWRVNCLLKILDLLPNPLQFRFAGDHALRNGGVVGFRAESIELAKNFLRDELQRATDRFVSAQMMRELGKVTFQTRQFFRDVGTIGEKGNFLQ